WSAQIKSVEIVELVANDVAVPQRGNHAERAEVHEGVDKKINQDPLHAVRAELSGSSCNQTEQHITDVRDGRIGQQALGIGLSQSGEVGARHGRDRNEDKEWDV